MEIDLQPMPIRSVISQDLTLSFDKARLTFGEEPVTVDAVTQTASSKSSHNVNRRRAFYDDLVFALLSVIFGCTIVGCVAVYYTVLAHILWNKNREKSKKFSEKSHIIATCALIAGLVQLVFVLLVYLLVKSYQECPYEVSGACYMTYIETDAANCTTTGIYEVDKVYKDGYCYYRPVNNNNYINSTTAGAQQ